jgi:hypothetical protein
VELTKRQHETIEAARRAMAAAIKEAYPLDLMPLYVVAIVGAFSDVCRNSFATGELLGIVNKELAGAGLEVIKKRRH